MNDSIQILVVDDQRVARRALKELLSTQPDFTVVGEAVDGLDAVRQVARLSPNVVLMDVTMPTLDGVEATRRILADFPDVKVIGYSTHDADSMASPMLEAGAVTYLEKTMPAETVPLAIRVASQE
jgi:DNA-binding NarL/FixJ family response regulator